MILFHDKICILHGLGTSVCTYNEIVCSFIGRRQNYLYEKVVHNSVVTSFDELYASFDLSIYSLKARTGH